MATKVTTMFECDGPYAKHAEADTIETVSMAMNGKEAQLDLCESCRARWDKALLAWMEVGRKPQLRRSVRQPVNGHQPIRPQTDRQRSKDMRQWAKDHKLPVSERGRLPESVVEQYEQEHQPTHNSRAHMALA